MPVLGGVVNPVEAGLVRVDLVPVIRRADRRKCQDGLLALHNRRCTVGSRSADGNRHLPDLRIGLLVPHQPVVYEPLLRKGNLHVVRASFGIHVQHRITHLLDPGIHNAGHWKVGFLFQRRPQVLRPGIAVLVGLEIPVQSLLEYIGRQEVLQHPQHRPPLAVADGVEELADLGRVLHFLLNGMRVLQSVQAQGPVGVHVDELRPHLPFREQPVDRLRPHPRGEALVQPQVVPPFHCDQVAKPHVGHLVRHNLGDPLPSTCRGVVRVDQQRRLPVGHTAPVLHRPGRKVRYGDMVQLGQRIGNVEVVVEVAQQLDRRIQGEPRLVLLAAGRPDAHPRSVGRIGLHGYDVSDHEGQQVGGHNRRLAEPDRLQSRRRSSLPHNRRVGDSLQAVVEHQRDVKGGLHGRFVPARERPAGVGGLKLGGCQVPSLTFVILVLRAIEAHQPVVQDARELHFQLSLAGGECLSEVQRGCFSVGI